MLSSWFGLGAAGLCLLKLVLFFKWDIRINTSGCCLQLCHGIMKQVESITKHINVKYGEVWQWQVYLG